MNHALKVLLSAVLIVVIAELGKRSTFWAAALASLPLTSVLAMIWMHLDGVPNSKIGELSNSIFWLVLPSLILFLAMPALFRWGLSFWPGLALACVATALAYRLTTFLLPRFGVSI